MIKIKRINENIKFRGKCSVKLEWPREPYKLINVGDWVYGCYVESIYGASDNNINATIIIGNIFDNPDLKVDQGM